MFERVYWFSINMFAYWLLHEAELLPACHAQVEQVYCVHAIGSVAIGLMFRGTLFPSLNRVSSGDYLRFYSGAMWPFLLGCNGGTSRFRGTPHRSLIDCRGTSSPFAENQFQSHDRRWGACCQ